MLNYDPHNLQRSAYAYEGPSNRNLTIVCHRPSIHISPWVNLILIIHILYKSFFNFRLLQTWYNLTLIDDVLDEFLKTPADLIINNDLFKYDLVDVTRQFLQNKIELLYPRIKKAFDSQDLYELRRVQHIFESILRDLDDILQTNEKFLLGKWLESAKLLATNQLEDQLYEYNARNQITTWGPKGEIIDYAYKQWAGLVRDYCLPRWQTLFYELERNIRKNNGNFDDSKCQQKIFKQVEEPFTIARKVYSVDAEGDTMKISRKILQKWRGNNAFVSIEKNPAGWDIFYFYAIFDIFCFCAIIVLWRKISGKFRFLKRKGYTTMA